MYKSEIVDSAGVALVVGPGYSKAGSVRARICHGVILYCALFPGFASAQLIPCVVRLPVAVGILHHVYDAGLVGTSCSARSVEV